MVDSGECLTQVAEILSDDSAQRLDYNICSNAVQVLPNWLISHHISDCICGSYDFDCDYDYD